MHVGNGSSPAITRMLEGVPRPYFNEFPQIHPLGTGIVSGPYVLYAFTQILGSQLLDDFPKLRVGFLEAGIEWTTRLVKALGAKKRTKVDHWLAERVFVSCALDDDLPYVASKLGDDFRQDRPAQGLIKRGDLS